MTTASVGFIIPSDETNAIDGGLRELVRRSGREPSTRAVRHWSPERSRTVRRYRFMVLTLVIGLGWSVAGIFGLVALNMELQQRTDHIQANLAAALLALREVGQLTQPGQVPAGSLPFQLGVPIALRRGSLVDAQFAVTDTPDAPRLLIRLRMAGSAAAAPQSYSWLRVLGPQGEPVAELFIDPSRDTPVTPLAPGETRLVERAVAMRQTASPTWLVLDQLTLPQVAAIAD